MTDLVSRRVASRSIRATVTGQFARYALMIALWRTANPDALLHHARWGSQSKRAIADRSDHPRLHVTPTRSVGPTTAVRVWTFFYDTAMFTAGWRTIRPMPILYLCRCRSASPICAIERQSAASTQFFGSTKGLPILRHFTITHLRIGFNRDLGCQVSYSCVNCNVAGGKIGSIGGRNPTPKA